MNANKTAGVGGVRPGAASQRLFAVIHDTIDSAAKVAVSRDGNTRTITGPDGQTYICYLDDDRGDNPWQGIGKKR